MYDFQQLAAIILLSTYGHTSGNLACISFFHTIYACETFIKVFYKD